MRIPLFQVAQAADELFAGDLFVVGEEVALGGLAGVVDEDVGVGSHTSDGADHITVKIIESAAEVSRIVWTIMDVLI